MCCLKSNYNFLFFWFYYQLMRHFGSIHSYALDLGHWPWVDFQIDLMWGYADWHWKARPRHKHKPRTVCICLVCIVPQKQNGCHFFRGLSFISFQLVYIHSYPYICMINQSLPGTTEVILNACKYKFTVKYSNTSTMVMVLILCCLHVQENMLVMSVKRKVFSFHFP